MKLSDYVVKFLAECGVKHVFLVAGGAAMHLNASLAKCKAIEPVCNQHEQASAMAAEAYAKAGGRLGVVMVTSGPGGTNAITGVAGAWLDSTPVLILSGQVKHADSMHTGDTSRGLLRQKGPQELDIVALVQSITKYSVTVQNPSSIRYHLQRALHEALTGRKGPAWLDIPLDVQAAEVDESTLVGFSQNATPVWKEEDLPSKVAQVIEALARSERPLILAGDGSAWSSGPPEALTAFVERFGVPVATTWRSAGILASDHPLHVGMPGTFATRGANFALQNCDFLLTVGARLDASMTAFAPERLAPEAVKVIVDIDAAEMQKLAPHFQVEVHADAGAFLWEMLEQLAATSRKDRSPWSRRCAAWTVRYPAVTDEHRRAEGPVSIYHLAEIIGREAAPSDVLVSGSSGNAAEIFLMACPRRAGQPIIHTAGLGAMGCAIPSAIGACLANGRKQTICVDGDGGFQFNVQELATVRNLGLPIKFFVVNNGGYASIRATQKAYFGEPLLGCDADTGVLLPNAADVAWGYGIPHRRIGSAGLREAVWNVLHMPGPVICEVMAIPDEERAPRVKSSMASDGTMTSGTLENLWPYLDREEFEENMAADEVTA